MNETTMESLKGIIQRLDNISDERKDELLSSLEVLHNFNGNVEENEELKSIFTELKEFVLNQDNYSVGDKLLLDHGLTLESTKEEVEAARDAELTKLEARAERCRYVDQYKVIRRQMVKLDEEYDKILANLDKRTLSGDLRDDSVKKDKTEALKDLIRLADSMEKYGEEVAPVEERINYNYSAMSEEEIEEARKQIEETPLAPIEDGEKDYLEPVEYFANTNVKKPRLQGLYESNEDYNAFLQEYYSRYDFSNVEATPAEETTEFYSDKMEYAKTKVKSYFDKVRNALTDLRWLYNHSLNETNLLYGDLDHYIETKEEKFVKETEDEIKVHEEFISEYEQKLSRINEMTSELFNDKPVKGDIVVSVELSRDNDQLSTTMTPLLSIIDEDLRKKFANYDANKVVDDEYKFDINTVKIDDLNDSLLAFIDSVTEELDDRDYEEIIKSNVEVVIDGEEFVMPIKDYGINVAKIFKLGTKAFSEEFMKAREARLNAKQEDLETQRVLTDKYAGMSKSDLEDRLKTIESEMQFRTHEENGVEAQAEDDNLLEEYQEIKDLLDNYQEDKKEDQTTDKYVGMSKEDLEDRLKTLESEMQFRTHQENGVEAQAEDDRLIEEYQEVKNLLDNYQEDKNEDNKEDSKDNILTEVDLEEPEIQTVEVNEDEADKKMEEGLKTTAEDVASIMDGSFVYPPKMPIGIEQKEDYEALNPYKKSANDVIDEAIKDMDTKEIPSVEPAVEEVQEEAPVEEVHEETPEISMIYGEDLSKKEENVEPSTEEVEPAEEQAEDAVVEESPIEEEQEEDIVIEEPSTEEEQDETIHRVVSVKKPKNIGWTLATLGLWTGVSLFVKYLEANNRTGKNTIILPVALGLGFLATYNLDNIKRAATKHTIKRLAKKVGGKAFFGDDDKIVIRTKDGLHLNEETEAKLQEMLDEKFNNKENRKDLPKVTTDSLENAFIYNNKNNDNFYVVSEAEAYDYDEVKDITAFESAGDHSWLDDEVPEKDKEADEENDIEADKRELQKIIDNMRNESNNLNTNYTTEMLRQQLMMLNPGIEHDLIDDHNEDVKGFYVYTDDPSSIVLPEGFEIVNDHITNRNSVEEGFSIDIPIMKRIEENDRVQQIIDEFGDQLFTSYDDLLVIMKEHPEYTEAEFEAAWDKYNTERVNRR